MMHKRLIGVTVLVLLIVSGLIAGLFAGSIQRALTLPMMQSMMGMTNAGNRVIVTPAPAKVKPTVVPKKQQGQATNTVLTEDTFQRTNQPLWGTATDGRLWSGDANTQQGFSVVQATGQIANSTGILNAMLGPVSQNSDVVMSAMINNFDGTVNLGVVLRLTDVNNCYKALIDGTRIAIIKRVNNQNIQLASQPFQASGHVMYKLHFRAIGAMLFASAWRSDTPEPANWMITISDPSFTSGQAGVRVLVQPATVINITSFTVSVATMGDMA